MISPARTDLKVTDNVPFGQTGQRSFFALSLENPHWENWLPGQFVMLRPHAWNFSWARPFSISRVTPRGLVLFFQVVGRGTAELAKLKPDDMVTVWGPLGTAFSAIADKPTLLLAGGIGIAPFVGYAEHHPTPARLQMLFGHRLPAAFYPTDTLSQHIDFEDFREKTTEDLARFKHMLRERMEGIKSRNGMVLACGPMPFLQTIWQNALELNLPTQLSLEQRMACGMGACLGCVTRTSPHWGDAEKAGLPVQTCTSGPVFWAEEIDLSGQLNDPLSPLVTARASA